MNAIPLWQPWATLIAIGEKRVETRSWKPPARLIGERVAIHACKGGLSKRAERDLLESVPEIVWALDRHGLEFDVLPRGAIVATATLTAYGPLDAPWVHELARTRPAELAFGDYTAGRYGWILDQVHQLPDPVPAVGRQGVYPLDAETVERIEAAA